MDIAIDIIGILFYQGFSAGRSVGCLKVHEYLKGWGLGFGVWAVLKS